LKIEQGLFATEDKDTAKPLLPDELWQIIEPLLPKQKPPAKGGRPRVGSRQALNGILFVLKTGIPGECLRQEMGCSCGMTCWRDLRDWQNAGIWDKIHKVLLSKLRKAEQIDFSPCSSGFRLCTSRFWGENRAEPYGSTEIGPKHHIITDTEGVPIATILTGGQV